MKYSIPIYSSTAQTIEKLESSVKTADICVKQLSKGEFEASSTVVDLGDVRITRRLNELCYSSDGWINDFVTFVFPIKAIWTYLNGIKHLEKSQMVYAGNQEIFGIFPEGSDYLFVTLDCNSLKNYLSTEEVLNFMTVIRSFDKTEVNISYKAYITRYIFEKYSLIMSGAMNNSLQLSAKEIAQEIVFSLYNYVFFHASGKYASRSNQDKIIFRAIKYFKANKKNKFELEKLSIDIYASKRAIQYAFSNILGITPHELFKMYKMNFIRNEIISIPDKKHISSVLYSHSISNAGRFSVEYNDFFCERPSVTLRNNRAILQR